MAKISIDENGCWNWTGTKHNGYGSVLFYRRGVSGSRNKNAYVAMYELKVGPVPSGLELDHLCRNKACCNPAHLEPVTHKENVLRGESLFAHQAKRTHCPKWHLYTGKNNRGERICQICIREIQRVALRRARNLPDDAPKSAFKTHCSKGHPFTEENTFLEKCSTGLTRRCRICKQESRLKPASKPGATLATSATSQTQGVAVS